MSRSSVSRNRPRYRSDFSHHARCETSQHFNSQRPNYQNRRRRAPCDTPRFPMQPLPQRLLQPQRQLCEHRRSIRGWDGSHGVFRLDYDAGSKLGAAAMAVLLTTIVLVVGPLAPPGSAPPGARDTRNGSPLGPVVQAARLAPAGPRSPRHPARPWSSR